MLILICINISKVSSGRVFLDYFSSEIGRGQLFYNTGKGFSEPKSYSFDVKKGRNLKEIILPSKNIIELRVDPIDRKEVTIDNFSLKIIDNNNKIFDLKINHSVGILTNKVNGDEISFLTENNDPIFIMNNINLTSKIKFNYRLFLVEFLIVGIVYIQRKKILNNKDTLLVFLLVFLLNLIRSPDAILNPVIYTEDGAWISEIMKKSFFYTIFNARKDYFVAGNILLLYFSYILNKISNLSLSKLPYFISIISYIFYAISYTYIYFVFEKIIKNKYIKILLIFLICFIPFGNSLNELLGRISNIGYIIPVLLLTAIISYENNIEKLGIYFLGILGLLTNPISFIYLGLYFLYRLYSVKNANYVKEFFSFIFLKFIYVLSFLIICWRYSVVGNTATLTSEKFLKENVIELVIARSFLYPFSFSFYNRLTNIIAIILIFFSIIFTVFIYKKSENKYKKIMLEVFCGWMIYTIMALVMRPGLTNWIKNYSNTFPDRYFYAQNILAIIFFLLTIDKGLEIKRTNIVSKIILIIITAIYLNNIFKLIEFSNPRMELKKETFEEALNRNLDLKKEILVIPISPDGWIMEIPTKELYK